MAERGCYLKVYHRKVSAQKTDRFRQFLAVCLPFEAFTNPVVGFFYITWSIFMFLHLAGVSKINQTCCPTCA